MVPAENLYFLLPSDAPVLALTSSNCSSGRSASFWAREETFFVSPKSDKVGVASVTGTRLEPVTILPFAPLFLVVSFSRSTNFPERVNIGPEFAF